MDRGIIVAFIPLSLSVVGFLVLAMLKVFDPNVFAALVTLAVALIGFYFNSLVEGRQRRISELGMRFSEFYRVWIPTYIRLSKWSSLLASDIWETCKLAEKGREIKIWDLVTIVADISEYLCAENEFFYGTCQGYFILRTRKAERVVTILRDKSLSKLLSTLGLEEMHDVRRELINRFGQEQAKTPLRYFLYYELWQNPILNRLLNSLSEMLSKNEQRDKLREMCKLMLCYSRVLLYEINEALTELYPDRMSLLDELEKFREQELTRYLREFSRELSDETSKRFFIDYVREKLG